MSSACDWHTQNLLAFLSKEGMCVSVDILINKHISFYNRHEVLPPNFIHIRCGLRYHKANEVINISEKKWKILHGNGKTDIIL